MTSSPLPCHTAYQHRMSALHRACWLWIVAGILLCTRIAVADGMVFAEAAYPQTRMPAQQALIHHADGVEHLVIQTGFAGEGTNFGWVVPVPSVPKVEAVSNEFFPVLQGAFRSQLIHGVGPYYAAVLFSLALGFLGWRCYRDEVSWIRDLPLCIALAAGAWIVMHGWPAAILALIVTLILRLCARTQAVFALLWMSGCGLALIAVTPALIGINDMFNNMGDVAPQVPQQADVTILSVQQAGLFQTTTIQGDTPAGVLKWLNSNGYQVPQDQAVVAKYVEDRWVFVASKVKRPAGAFEAATLHPLAFTFPTKTPVYPTRLTALASTDCRMDLYVFGTKRARAPHFSVVRCDKLDPPGTSGVARPGRPLRISSPAVLKFIGNSTVGTKLSGTLTPEQMQEDVQIGYRFYSHSGRLVYSASSARMIALNISVSLAGITWALLGLTRGSLGVNERRILRWRMGALVLFTWLGITVFLLLPKVEVVMHHIPIE